MKDASKHAASKAWLLQATHPSSEYTGHPAVILFVWESEKLLRLLVALGLGQVVVAALAHAVALLVEKVLVREGAHAGIETLK